MLGVNAHQLEVGEHQAGGMLIVVAAFAFAVNAFVIHRILRVMDAEAVATFNHAASGVAFAAILLIKGFTLPEPVRQQPIQWGWIAALGVGSAISLPTYDGVLRRMAVWKLRAYMLTGPVLVAVADWLIWGVTLYGWQWRGAILLLGAIHLLGGASARLGRNSPSRPRPTGDPDSRSAMSSTARLGRELAVERTRGKLAVEPLRFSRA